MGWTETEQDFCQASRYGSYSSRIYSLLMISSEPLTIPTAIYIELLWSSGLAQSHVIS